LCLISRFVSEMTILIAITARSVQGTTPGTTAFITLSFHSA